MKCCPTSLIIRLCIVLNEKFLRKHFNISQNKMEFYPNTSKLSVRQSVYGQGFIYPQTPSKIFFGTPHPPKIF